jgi:hypothetical protein
MCVLHAASFVVRFWVAAQCAGQASARRSTNLRGGRYGSSCRYGWKG